jgi:hypothetical protein
MPASGREPPEPNIVDWIVLALLTSAVAVMLFALLIAWLD